MALFKEELDELLTYYERIAEMYNKDLEEAPAGSLMEQNNNGYKQFLHSYNDIRKNRRVRKGINSNVDMIRALARKKFAESALGVLNKNIDVLKRAINSIIPFDPDEILDSMTYAYRLLPEDYFFDRESLVTDLDLEGADDIRCERHEEWGNEAYDESTYHMEYKNKRTSRGQYVRSKSELLIIETLYHYNVPAHYEEQSAVNGMLITPDFTFQDAEGKPFYWEHLGK